MRKMKKTKKKDKKTGEKRRKKGTKGPIVPPEMGSKIDFLHENCQENS